MHVAQNINFAKTRLLQLSIFSFVLAGNLLVTACTSLPSTTSIDHAANQAAIQALQQQHQSKLAQIKQFNLSGRIAVNTNNKGYSGGLTWAHRDLPHIAHTDKLSNDNWVDNLQVFSPLGGKVADISKTLTNVTLKTADNLTYNADNAESLTELTLGWRLPLSGLSNWVLGKPNINDANDPTTDALGRIVTLKQEGWDIEYAQYNEVGTYSLPSKIFLRSPQVNLKLVVEHWDVQ